MNDDISQSQEKQNTGAVMDVRPPAKPTETPALASANPDSTAVATEHSQPDGVQAIDDSAVRGETQSSDTHETPVVESAASPDADAAHETPNQDAQEEVSPAADGPLAAEPQQDPESPLLAATSKPTPKRGFRWVLVFAVIVVLALIGAAVAAYRAANDTHKDETHKTPQSDTTTAVPDLEAAQSAVGAASDAVEETLKDLDETEFTETELEDDQLGL